MSDVVVRREHGRWMHAQEGSWLAAQHLHAQAGARTDGQLPGREQAHVLQPTPFLLIVGLGDGGACPLHILCICCVAILKNVFKTSELMPAFSA